MVFFFFFCNVDGQSEVEVKLITREYVERGSTIILHCKHNVDPKVLYKVCSINFISVVLLLFIFLFLILKQTTIRRFIHTLIL